MTVYVVVCADPVEGGDVWVHGVYTSHQMAKRVFQRLNDETCNTIRLSETRLRKPRAAAEEGANK